MIKYVFAIDTVDNEVLVHVSNKSYFENHHFSFLNEDELEEVGEFLERYGVTEYSPINFISNKYDEKELIDLISKNPSFEFNQDYQDFIKGSYTFNDKEVTTELEVDSEFDSMINKVKDERTIVALEEYLKKINELGPLTSTTFNSLKKLLMSLDDEFKSSFISSNEMWIKTAYKIKEYVLKNNVI